MDVNKYLESDFVTKDVLEHAVNKQFVILGADEKVTKFGERLVLQVELDNKVKSYTLSRKVVIQLVKLFGGETQAWIGKCLSYTFVGSEIVLFSLKKIELGD